LASRCDERIYRRVSIGALTVKYSFSNGSFWECAFCPKMAIMGAEPSAAAIEERLLSGMGDVSLSIRLGSVAVESGLR
jgi:hypothetical protein